MLTRWTKSARSLKRATSALLVMGLVFSGAGSAAALQSERELSGTPRVALGAHLTEPVAGCQAPLRQKPVRLSAVVGDRAALEVVAQRASREARALVDESIDPAVWVDRCGDIFYRESQAPARVREAKPASSNQALVAPLSQTFALESRPGSSRTIYLDFRGGTVSGTAWNDSERASTLPYLPFSITAPADTSFTTAELTEIQRTWVGVAEDYAPFDVNVTTADPGYAAINRASTSDLVFGTRVVITSGSPMYDSCGCGGVAYTDVFDIAGSQHDYYQPAWVFTEGVGTNGKIVADTASHEVGHNFGLDHDGSLLNPYYSGEDPWAPLMGASYYEPITQWSRGEYPGANNPEDDLAIIARNGAPVRPDDAGNSSAPVSLTDGLATGTITSAGDQDAYQFQAQGATTISVVDAELSNLDAQLTVLDAAGTIVATANPVATKLSPDRATGLGATISLQLVRGTYVAVVQGAAGAKPANQSGGYSTYGSLGNYTLAVATEQTSSGPVLSVASLPTMTQGTFVSAPWLSATGGAAPYRYSASGLPEGLAVDPDTGAVAGTPVSAGTYAVTVRAVDADQRVAESQMSLSVMATSALVVPDRVIVAAPSVTSETSLTATGSQGVVNWSVAAAPDWLRVSSEGVLTVTPPRAGTYFVDVSAREVDGPGRTATGRMTIDVLDGSVAVTTSAVAAEAGQPVSATLQASGGTGAYRWSASGLPSGLVLSSAGHLTGDAPAEGVYQFAVTATSGSSGQPATKATRTIQLQVSGPGTTGDFAVVDAVFSGSVGSMLGGQLSVSRDRVDPGVAVAWEAANLPGWLSLTSGGFLSGVPEDAGVFVFEVTATDGESSDTGTVEVLVSEDPGLRVVSSTVRGRVGQSMNERLSVEGSVDDVSWVIVAGTLPPGLTLSRAGLLTGTPSSSGQWLVEVEATDGVSTARGTVTIDIDADELSAVEVADQTVSTRRGASFSIDLVATGGDGNYTWGPGVGSALPAGVTLSSGGRLTGRIDRSGTYSFAVRATSETDSTRQSGTGTVTLVVAPARFRFATSPNLSGMRVGRLTRILITTAGAEAPAGSFVVAQWRRTGVLPPGLTARVIDSGSAVMLWGVPRKVGVWSFRLTARDGAGRVIRRTFTVRVRR